MRVLVTTPAGLGHIHPMVPLARAMAARGHELLWATPSDGVAHVERSAIPVVARVFNNPAPLQMVLAAFGNLDLRALVTVGPQADPFVVGDQPVHVRVELP